LELFCWRIKIQFISVKRKLSSCLLSAMFNVYICRWCIALWLCAATRKGSATTDSPGEHWLYLFVIYSQ
jgi:hypothetical protein